MKKLIEHIIEINFSDSSVNQPCFTGLIEGTIGQILVLGHYGTINNNPQYKNHFDRLLQQLTPYNRNDFSLGYGLTGIAWLLRELQKMGAIKQDDKQSKNIDMILSSQYETVLNKGNLDYFAGAAGILQYFVQAKLPDCEKKIKAFFNLFQQQYEQSLFGQKSYTNDNITVNTTNLGVPHGLTGILLLLLSIKEKLSIDYKYLIDTILERLNKNLNPAESIYRLPCFEGWQHPSTLAWCYGDLPLLYALTKYTALYGENQYTPLTKELLKTTVKRKDHFENNLTLCHGTIVIAYFFYKLSKWYGKTDEIENACTFWKKQTQNICQKKIKEHFAGSQETNYLTNPSLLMGYPGMLLAMMTIEGMIPEHWDNCLLL